MLFMAGPPGLTANLQGNWPSRTVFVAGKSYNFRSMRMDYTALNCGKKRPIPRTALTRCYFCNTTENIHYCGFCRKWFCKKCGKQYFRRVEAMISENFRSLVGKRKLSRKRG